MAPTYRWQRVGVNLAHWMRRTQKNEAIKYKLTVLNLLLIAFYARDARYNATQNINTPIMCVNG